MLLTLVMLVLVVLAVVLAVAAVISGRRRRLRRRIEAYRVVWPLRQLVRSKPVDRFRKAA